MPILVVIDGLDPDAFARLSVVDRLAATGRTGRLRFSGEPRFEFFGRLVASPVSPEWDLPLGHATALGLMDRKGTEWPDPDRTWCCLGFTHLYQKQNDLIFLSAERTGQSHEECWDLVEAVLPDLEEAGWVLHPPSRLGSVPLLSRSAALDPPALVRTSPLEELDGCSFRKRSPVGPYANTLLSLLTVGQLVLARHPVNRDRKQAGRLPLNTPWMWGVGRGMACAPLHSAGRGYCWTGHPVVAGLARASGHALAALDEQADFSPLVTAIRSAMTTGVALIHLSLPAVLARHGLLDAHRTLLQRINDQLLEPLTRTLAGTQETMVITSLNPLSEDGHCPWVMASGRALARQRRFWHRGRPGMGEEMSPVALWSMCGL